MRSHFLVKLALLDRRRGDPAPVLARQRETLTTIARALDGEAARHTGFDAVLFSWRRATTASALDFVEDLSRASTTR
jgi:hypothetical protein